MRVWFSTNLSRRSLCLLSMVFLVSVLAAGICAASSGGAEGGHGGTKLIDFAWRILNFAVLAFLLYKMTWRKIKDFFVGRREGIKIALEQAVAAKEEAEKKFKEYSDRLAKATEEIAGISEMIKAQGQVEKEKIIENAKIAASKMKEDAKARMEQDLAAASSRLRAEAAELSVKLAEETLKRKVEKKDHEQMVKDFLDRMVKQN
ncbi:MAG: hypothetical protein ACE14T_10355 [Syntrophales bacterium]